jgi:hypothetical protein
MPLTPVSTPAAAAPMSAPIGQMVLSPAEKAKKEGIVFASLEFGRREQNLSHSPQLKEPRLPTKFLTPDRLSGALCDHLGPDAAEALVLDVLENIKLAKKVKTKSKHQGEEAKS